jgi:hypothetical protein
LKLKAFNNTRFAGPPRLILTLPFENHIFIKLLDSMLDLSRNHTRNLAPHVTLRRILRARANIEVFLPLATLLNCPPPFLTHPPSLFSGKNLRRRGMWSVRGRPDNPNQRRIVVCRTRPTPRMQKVGRKRS